LLLKPCASFRARHGCLIAFLFALLLKKIVRLPKPEPWADRRGRVLGNMLGFCDLVRRRLHPRRILDFD
jgi:hypothetical protein